ncbi:MAG: type II toxin-antitoxin system VapC family toxin [Candidatus Competibacteraceae bacterium]|jgi:tRNA(fMet)-specific endonuclease VapC|nr:type II toxin-antitoxin system VapC family toxin [Candidatus Competibacteraceae bacterium]
MMYLLDTNTLIYFFKGFGKVSERLLAKPPKTIGIPAVVLYELNVGIQKSQAAETRRIQLNRLLQTTKTYPFGPAEALASATIRVALEKQGTPIGPLDVLIAGTAMTHNAILVTHNCKEFSRIQGLTFEDWY